jgi:tRNA dimethylallyltransferase
LSQKKLILVAGPTAVGKTEFCIRLARLFDAEIFSCDSRQFYRELSVGTAKPTAGELDAVRHHFIDNLSVADDYSVATYEKEINAALKTYFIEKDTAVLTGGSGLFMKAVTHGLDPIPDIPATLRSGFTGKRIEAT